MRTVKFEKTSKELNALEKLAYQDTSDCMSLDKVLEESVRNGQPYITISPAEYVLLAIHTDKPKAGASPDYNTLIIIDTDGNKYATGSNTFIESFVNIFDTLREENVIDYKVKVMRKDSTNYKGKYFLTCNVAI